MDISSSLKTNISNNEDDEKAYITVVMPAYNEGVKIKNNLLKASATISAFVKNYKIIAVNDGSHDNTSEEIQAAALEDSHIRYLDYPENKGKGYAIRLGVNYANADYIAFLDSDLELDPSMLRYFLKALLSENADIAIGSKLHKKSKLEYPFFRRIMSIGYFVMLKIIFRLNIKDTQTGIKLFRGPVIKSICADLITDGFAFDIEILATANNMGCKIIEMPIKLKFERSRKEKSRFSSRIILKIFKDTLKIKRKLK